MSKFKEWFIDGSESNNYETFVVSSLNKLTDHGKKSAVHVVEKSALDECVAENEKLRTANAELVKALKSIAQETGTPYADVANEALAKHGGKS